MSAIKATESKTFLALLIALSVTGLTLFTRHMPSESTPHRVEIFSTARAAPLEKEKTTLSCQKN